MRLGFVGLGRMGGNMVQRLVERGRHELVVYDPSPDAVRGLDDAGVASVASLAELVCALAPPRAIWLMVPAGEPVERTVQSLANACAPGDLLVDGGNSHYKDTVRRAGECRAHGLELADAGTSGGVFGREQGYCLMVGASAESFERLSPALASLAPEGGYRRVGPPGAGHFAKMVHNAIEYGMM
jgi:6-phosphogluconate dehydrogenase